jgi:putative ABC transport system permease protein
MFRSHFVIFIKTLLKNKLLTIINLSGLSIGLIVSILIWAFVSHELSYDESFSNADRVFRIIRNWQGSRKFSTDVPAPLAEALRSGFPDIVNATRLYCSHNNIVIRNQEVFREDMLLVVDSTFFDVFGIRIKNGNTDLCLKRPGSVIISESASGRLFGSYDPVGKDLLIESSSLGINHGNYTVTGVFEDFPVNSHMKPDFLLSSTSFRFIDNPSHVNHFLQTYVLLESADQEKTLEDRLPDFMKEFYGSEYYDYSGSTYLLQPIKDIHLNANVYYAGYETPKGSYLTIYFFPALAVLIVIISLINFINLHTSQSLRRRKEIWIKKIFGAPVLGELSLLIFDSVLLSLIALVIAVCVLEICFPSFELLIDRQINQDVIYSAGNFFSVILIVILSGVLAGIYPALVLISANTVNDLNMWREFKTTGVFFNSKLIILQFALCIVFLIGSIFIYKQFMFINHETARGFNKENILLIKNPWYLKNSNAAFKAALRDYSGITGVTSSESVPGIDQFSVWGLPVDSAASNCHLMVIYCDYDYTKTLNLKVVQGRFFSTDYPTDNLAIVLNEAAIKTLGWNEPIGKRYRLDTVYNVIGVIQDFHFESLHEIIEPMGLVLIEPGTESFISMRIGPGSTDELITFVKDTWKTFVPDRPVELSFMDREFDFWYRTDRKIGLVTTLLSILAVVISCLGLLGLMIYITLRRTKEIGIRKVNGATTWNILFLFLRDTSKWLLVAFGIAIPISLFAMKKWIQSFAYHTEINWWTITLAGVLVYLIATGTIIWQSYKTARSNPADSLRYE